MDIERMFTTFINTPAPGSPPRQAEQSDARQEIKRHDPDQRGKKHEDADREKDIFADEDKASVSVAALLSFLTEFLKTLDSEEEKSAPVSPSIAASMNAQAKQPPVSGNAAAAHSAYAAAAKTKTHGSGLSAQNAQQAATSLGLSGGEVRTIHELIEGLKELSARGIENLDIERSTSFLQSLVNAVEKARSS